MPMIQWKTEDADGAEIVISFPATWEICDSCRGEGTQDCFPGGITSSEWQYEWEQDEKEAYLAGHYDMPCECCKGDGKVKMIDQDACTGDLADWLEAYHKEQQAWYYHRMECEAERRMGA